ncbi:hypothetical protein N7510_006473 [Penicillium lagena]|uniref:uncharacterized protein n=1 Tax=Penicillium lagena TaxID=94218 RepID=UPI002540BF3F|nr:uncharacterized protein N7510_006473 [Penicillium lagena]KAJ5613279.1 hypothetical protein N7510_006473 [Penicillium lagena]
MILLLDDCARLLQEQARSIFQAHRWSDYYGDCSAPHPPTPEYRRPTTVVSQLIPGAACTSQSNATWARVRQNNFRRPVRHLDVDVAEIVAMFHRTLRPGVGVNAQVVEV